MNILRKVFRHNRPRVNNLNIKRARINKFVPREKWTKHINQKVIKILK